jgi:mono/diheme cytochrome c family protein
LRNRLIGSGCGVAMAVVLAGCSAKHGADAPATQAPALTVAPVAWNSGGTDVGQVQAVVEQDKSVYVFGSTGVYVFTGGSLVASDGSVTSWKSAAAVPSADGLTTWTVGVSGDGKVLRVHTDAPAEEVGDRYGVGSDKVQAVVGDAGRAAFLFDTGFAVSDGKNVTRYGAAGLHSIATSGAFVALAVDGGVRVFDDGKETDLGLADAAFVAYDATGALFAATHHAVYKVDGVVATKVYDGGARTVHDLAASGANVWFALDADLGLVTGGAVAVGSGGTLAADARLAGSPTGDVWAESGGQLLRFAAQTGATGDEATWTSTVEPVFNAVCSNCHSAAGTGKDSSGIDLTTYAAWSARKTKVYARVVQQAGTGSSMPPPTSGFTLTDAQKSALEAWSKP